MRRVNLPILAGLLMACLLCSNPVTAQSKKKLGGPFVEIEGLKSQVYDFWKPQKAGAPYAYQFLLPKDLKTEVEAADLLIYPLTGKSDEIISNWKNRWLPPKGVKTIEDVARTDTFKLTGATATRLNIQGTYLKTAKPDDSINVATKMDDYRMSAYVFEVKGKAYAIQLVGPFRTTGLHMQDLETWVKAFK